MAHQCRICGEDCDCGQDEEAWCVGCSFCDEELHAGLNGIDPDDEDEEEDDDLDRFFGD